MNVLSGTSRVAQYRALVPQPPARGAASKSAGAARADTLDLSTGLTLEKIQDLLKTSIGEKVAGLFAEAGVAPAEAAGVDFSPEATADRIVDFSAGLYDIFKDQNTHLSDADVIDKFEATLRKAVDQGAAEAFSLIGATLGEDALEVGHRTMDLVHARYDEFFSQLRGDNGKK